MLTQRVQNNLTKLIGMANCCDDIMNCRLIVINKDSNWKKSIKDTICNDHTLFPYKYYNLTCEQFTNDECVKTEYTGCINLQINKMLESMDILECMIITINNMVDIFNKEKGRLERPKFVYIIAKN